jgi:hypothetical protein
MIRALILTDLLIAFLSCEAKNTITFTLLAPTIVTAMLRTSTHFTTITLPAIVTVTIAIHTNAVP